MMPGSNFRRIGWAAVLLFATALYSMLHFTVNSVKSEVRLAERRIVALEKEKFRLETEYLTRSNQRQLAEWNEVDFGYQAPDASQFIARERDLAALGAPRSANAPQPIRVASLARAEEEEMDFAAMVPPLTGKAMAAEPVAGSSVVEVARERIAREFRPDPVRDLSARLSSGGARVSLRGAGGVAE